MPSLNSSPVLKSGELKQKLKISLDDYVVDLAAGGDGKRLWVGLGTGDWAGIDLGKNELAFRLRAHEGGLLALKASPSGEHVLTSGQGGAAKLWSANGQLIEEIPNPKVAMMDLVAWSPRSDRFALGAGRRVKVYDARDGRLLFESEELKSTVSGLSFRGDGSGVIASCYGGVWSFPLISGAKVKHLEHPSSLTGLALSPDDRFVACPTQEKTVHFWRLSSDRDAEMHGYRFRPKVLSWDAESRLLGTTGDSVVTLWDFRGKGPEGTHPIRLDAHQGLCTQLAFSPQACRLMSGAEDASVLLWEPRRSTGPKGFAFLEDKISSIVWDKPGRSVFVGDAAGTVLQLDVS